MTRSTLAIAGLLMAVNLGCSRGSGAEQIRLGAAIDSLAVERSERLTDGERAFEGSPWNSEAVAFFRGRGAYVVFDLGEVQPIEAVYLQGDNNDQFIVDASENGTDFALLWKASAVEGQGLRARWASGLGARARFVRLRAIGGDASVSVSELQLFSKTPEVWPPAVSTRLEMSSSIGARLALLSFGVLASLSVFFHRRTSRRRFSAALWAGAALCGGAAVYRALVVGPVEASVIDVSRAVCAAVACAVVLRLGLRPEDARERVLTGLLAAMACLSVLTFYNFGRPQFYDVEEGEPSYVHTWDLRVYFPVVKYFDELGYDGVYLASVKAYADEELAGSLDPIARTELRDLRTYEMRKVSDVAQEIHAVKDRFSPARWSEFKKDMSYFWKTMGPSSYLDSLRDHGGNATPAWLSVAYLFFGRTEANDETFLWTALLDPFLLVLFFLAAWRTFGLRAALVCMVAYGATTIYQFGTNWGGSTLRNDWMVLIGLGVCALQSGLLFVAGMLLGWSAMIRAFPLLALVFLAGSIAWLAVAARRERGDRTLGRGSFLEQLIPLAKVGAGVAVMIVALGALSASTYGFEKSWGPWSEKIAMHANIPAVNHVGLTALVSYDPDNLGENLRARGEDPEMWRPLTAQTMKDRRWVILLGILVYTLLGLLACRGSRLSDAAVIGTMMIPIYFYPSNYYLHILFLWPLLLAAREGRDGDRAWPLIAATILGFCALQGFGWLIPGNYGKYLVWSGMLLALITIVLVITVQANARGAAVNAVSSERASPSLSQ